MREGEQEGFEKQKKLPIIEATISNFDGFIRNIDKALRGEGQKMAE